MFFRIRWKNREIRNTIYASNKMEYTRQRKKASRLIDRMAWRIEQIKIRICIDYVYDLSRWRMEFTRTEREAMIISRDSRMKHDDDDDKIKEGKRDEKGTKRSASKRASFTWFLWSLLGCTRTTRVMSNNTEVCCIHTSTVTFYPALLPLPWTIPMKLDVIYDFDRASNKRTSVERIFFLRDKQLDPLFGILFWRQFRSVIGRTSTSDVGRPSWIGQLSKI